MNSKRLYVGNLSSTVTEADIENLFSKFGNVSSIELRNKVVDDNTKYFAFVDLQIDDSLIPRVIKRLSCTKWKGQEISIQVAKESFMQRLQKEREQTRNLMAHSSPAKKNSFIKSSIESRPSKVIKFDNLDSNTEESQVDTRIKNDNIPKADEKASLEKLGDERRVEDNERRLNSLVEKRKQMNQQKTLVKAALTHGKQLSKRIVFDNEESNKKLVKKPLFENENDEEGMSNLSFDNKFGSKKSEKLIALQSKFAHDPRFQINEKFVEDEKSDEEQDIDQKDDNQDETEHNISMLEQVLGKSVRKQPSSVDNKKTVKRSLLIPRFDPSKSEDTEKYELKKKQKVSIPEEPLGEKEESVQETASKERYYEVSSSLKNIGNEDGESGNTFTFSQLFGSNDNKDPESNDLEECVPLRKKAIDLENNQSHSSLKTDASNSVPRNYSIRNEKFFFDEDDPRFSEDSFFNKELSERSEKEWNKLKSAAISVLGRRRRFAKKMKLKSSQTEFKGNRKPKKFQHSKKNKKRPNSQKNNKRS